jgi:hypothetical protein
MGLLIQMTFYLEQLIVIQPTVIVQLIFTEVLQSRWQLLNRALLIEEPRLLQPYFPRATVNYSSKSLLSTENCLSASLFNIS